MKSGRDISLRKKIKNSSIILKLIVSTVSIFALMLLVSSVLLQIRQQQLTTEFAERILDGSVTITGGGQSTILVSAAQGWVMDEYRIYAFAVITLCILAGGILLALVIFHLLRPLKEMAAAVCQVDINHTESARIDLGSYGSSKEIRELADSFRQSYQKIHDNYEKQKQFSTNIAHELRTPLSVLQTKVDVFKAKKDRTDADVRDLTDTLSRNIERLSKLVEDLLFLSRDTRVKKHEASLIDICEEVVLDLDDRAREKGITLCTAGDDIILMTDDLLLERALYNLVDNAIKYTQPGGICKIDVCQQAGKAVIRVTDNGPGIPDEKKEQVFDLFYRMDSSRNQNTGGYGVGLSLVKDIIQKLHGAILLTDNEPAGCIFQIELPVLTELTNDN
jgi:signal transduction histidine kinase